MPSEKDVDDVENAYSLPAFEIVQFASTYW